MSEAAPAENSTTPNGTDISKIFIGSLSFKTGKPSLTKAFTDLGVEVKTAKVVRNNTGRSMGYGFVEIPDKDVDLVISKLHHTELDGRQINVEKATSTKPKRKTKRPQRPRKTTTEPGESQPAAPKTEKTTKPAPVKKEKKPVTRRTNPNPTPREASETKLYVANIPFSLTDAELAAVFADYGKVEGKVIVNKKTGRSRGYGFVDVENGELQKKAIAEKNKAEVGGRPITVRAAYRELPTPEPTAESGTATEAKTEPKAEEQKDAAAKSPAKKNKKPKKKVVKKDKPAGEKAPNKEAEAPKTEEKPAENKETPSA